MNGTTFGSGRLGDSSMFDEKPDHKSSNAKITLTWQNINIYTKKNNVNIIKDSN
jgi:hypothetical protein